MPVPAADGEPAGRPDGSHRPRGDPAGHARPGVVHVAVPVDQQVAPAIRGHEQAVDRWQPDDSAGGGPAPGQGYRLPVPPCGMHPDLSGAGRETGAVAEAPRSIGPLPVPAPGSRAQSSGRMIAPAVASSDTGPGSSAAGLRAGDAAAGKRVRTTSPAPGRVAPSRFAPRAAVTRAGHRDRRPGRRRRAARPRARSAPLPAAMTPAATSTAVATASHRGGRGHRRRGPNEPNRTTSCGSGWPGHAPP